MTIDKETKYMFIVITVITLIGIAVFAAIYLTDQSV